MNRNLESGRGFLGGYGSDILLLLPEFLGKAADTVFELNNNKYFRNVFFS
jgi:hypothetical protein